MGHSRTTSSLALLLALCAGVTQISAIEVKRLGNNQVERLADDVPLRWWPLADVEKQETQRPKKKSPLGPHGGCGFSTDCQLDYNVSEINTLANAQSNSVEHNTNALKSIHVQAREACMGTGKSSSALATGGWCYSKHKARIIESPEGKWMLPRHHILADQGFTDTLATKILLKDDGSCCRSLTDFGAGVGQFGHAIRAKFPDLEYHGYDGAGNVEEFTDQYVKFIDLTMPLSLKRTDWVISSEVGEHIPHRFEKQMLANIDAHNCEGVVLTWATLNQNGNWHINNHANGYLINIFEGIGYNYDNATTAGLREGVGGSYWLKRSSMVFRRIKKPDGCK